MASVSNPYNIINCFKKGHLCGCCDGCCNINQQNHCFHCYSTEYQNSYYREEINDGFFTCPGVYCVFESCMEWLDGESGNTEVNSSCCCNSAHDPPCHDCACVCLPLACVLDLMCLIPRLFTSKKSGVCFKNERHINTSIEQPSVNKQEMPPKTLKTPETQ